MLKAVWFQLHWLLGITAGIVLAVVGVTGAMLSFEGDILDALNPGIRTVEAQPAGPLAPAALLPKIRAAAPDRPILGLTVSSDPEKPALVWLALPPGAEATLEVRYVNPYDGTLLGDLRGGDFFQTVMAIHRWLAVGEPGRQVVGASALALVVLTLSGLYLRWPRRWTDWRKWLRLDLSRRGRTLLWDLHSVIGTWLLPFYLLAALTGLYWSYDWYRGALHDLTGTPRAQAESSVAESTVSESPASESSASERPADPPGTKPGAGGAAGLPDIERLWPVFLKESGGFTTASLFLPPGGTDTLTVAYVPLNPAHGRAENTLVLDRAGAVRTHTRYADLPFGQKIIASMFELHSGSYFGIVGIVLVMLASLLMPPFAVTGWMLYLDRRRKKQAVLAAARALGPETGVADAVLVAFASQSGTAERLAWRSAAALRSGGVPVRVASLATLSPQDLAQAGRALFVVSTFGEGEPPDSARAFARKLSAAPVDLGGLRFGLLALGDRAYADFCDFGHRLDRWLRSNGAQPLFPVIEMDGEDGKALSRWQGDLGQLAPAGLDWEGAEGEQRIPEPAFAPWTLVQRACLNPQGAGLPTYQVALVPGEGAALHWQAGDIVEIRPRQSAEAVERFLTRAGLSAEASVMHDGRADTLGAVLARSALPEDAAADDAQALTDGLTPLPQRAYSIASLPADGRLELLVRQSRAADGSLGIGSGFLTVHLVEGGTLEARIRPNPAFAPPEDGRPMILIGNGTGLAALRAHLKARIGAGHGRNWLIFGERSAASDFYFRDEITSWREAGALSRLDLAFSRDQNSRVYVQDRLKAAAGELAAWVREGAAIYVCGSLQGMAPAVDAVLGEVLGAQTLEAMAAERRYCRDVY